MNPLTTTSRSNGKSLVFEHRAELEKSVVIGRLRGEVSRLKEQMIATEAELTDVKRSCQSTALAEMMAAGEEYMIEVRQLTEEFCIFQFSEGKQDDYSLKQQKYCAGP